MTEEGGSGTRLVCPACGRAREAGGRFCPGCGLDYWRLAAGGTIESAGGARPARKSWLGRGRRPAPTPAPAPPPTPTRPSGVAAAASGAQQPGNQAAAPHFGTPAAPVATPDGASPAPMSPVQRAVAVLRVPQSPRSRLLVGGLVAAIALLIVAALVMRPSGPTATGPTAQPSPTAPAPDDVIGAFFQSVRDPAAAFEVKVTGAYSQVAKARRTAGSITSDMRVVGDSLSGTLRLSVPGSTLFNASIVRIGQKSWTRVSGAAWRGQSLPAAADAVNPFAWIATVDDLAYLRAGPGQGGQRTHILESTKWLSGTEYDDIVVQLTDAQRDSRLEVEATDAGVPIRATYRFTIRGTLAAGPGTLEFSGSSEYTFSHWGEALTIGPPA